MQERNVSIFLLVLLLAGALLFAQLFHHPGGYQLPSYLRPAEIDKVEDASQLLPAAELCLSEAAEIQPGEEVVLITDPTVPAVVEDAFLRTLQRQVSSYQRFEVAAPTSDWSQQGWGEELWQALKNADVALSLSFFTPGSQKAAVKQRLKDGARLVTVSAVPELLASSWIQTPRGLADLLLKRARAALPPRGVLYIQDPAGTDLQFAYRSVQALGLTGPIRHFPLDGRLIFEAATSPTNGRVVTHSSSWRLHPPLQLQLRNGYVDKILGGGAWGESLETARQEEGLRLDSVEVALSSQGFRYPGNYSGSGQRWGHFAGAQRPGSALLNWVAGEEHRGQNALYFPTIETTKGPWIQEGYPGIFLEPEIRQAAAAYSMSKMLVPQCVLLPDEMPTPKIPEVETVTQIEALAPAVKTCLEEYLELQPSEPVLLVHEGSRSNLVAEAFERELGQRQHPLQILNAFHELSENEDPLELARILQGSHLDSAALQQIRSASAVLLFPCSDPVNWVLNNQLWDQALGGSGARLVAVVPSPEILASPWATFPKQLHRTLEQRVLQSLGSGTTGIITSGQGSSLIFDFRARAAAQNFDYFPPLSRLELIPEREGEPDGDGMLMFSRFFSQAVPRTEFELEKALVLAADGVGPVGRLVRELASGTSASQTRLSRILIGLNPKVFPFCPPGVAAPNWGCLVGESRSGIVDFVFAADESSPGPWHFQMLFANVNAGGTTVAAERGRLLMLDDPEIRSLAGEQAESLLVEDWIPALRSDPN